MTMPILAMFGIELYTLDENDNLNKIDKDENHFFGQLLIQKYPLTIGFEEVDQDIEMTVMIATDPIPKKSYVEAALAFMVVMASLISISYISYELKVKRLNRDHDAIKKFIYGELMKRNPKDF